MLNNTETNDEEITIKRLEVNEISENDEFINYKTIIVGDSGVGKSCLLKRAVQKKFTENYQATIGFEFLLLYYDINGAKIKLQIWDTCGQEMYRSLVQGFYRNTSLTLLIYTINDSNTFDNLADWLKDIKNNTENNMPIFLVGNKCDLKDDRTVQFQTGKDYAKQNGLMYFNETSAKTGYNVDDVFQEMAKYLYKECYLKGKNKNKKLKMDLEQNAENSQNTKKKCC